jgi:hypothetical protein
MNHDQICERLPWLLNGTLEAGERGEVEEHLKSCKACRQALAETRLAWDAFDQHIPTEQLVAHAWGDQGVDRQVIEEHLRSCPQCAAELELVGISRRLEAAEDSKVPLLVPAAHRRPAPARIWRSSAIAASLVGLIAATGWIESSQRMHSLEETLAARQASAPPPALRGASAGTASRLRQAQEQAVQLARQNEQLKSETAALRESEKKIEAQVSQLQQTAAAGAGRKDILGNGATASPPPLRNVERGTPAGAASEVPFAAPYVVLTVVSTHDEAYDRYEMVILDAAGKESGKVRDLHPEAPSNQFVVLLPKGSLARGSYTLQLYGLRAGQRVALDTYAIRVV